MAEADPFQGWVEQFRREVDDILAQPSPPAVPAAQSAQERFTAWWRTSQEPVAAESPASAGPLDTAQDRLLTAEWPGKLERLIEEKARLQREASELRKINAELVERQGRIQAEVAEFEASLSRSREGYEGHISQLQAQARGLEEQVKTLKAVQESHARLDEDRKRLDEELRTEREKGALSERRALELKHELERKDVELAKLREHSAALAGAMEELRRQATVYQERLVAAKELTDSDIVLLRQEIRMFLEEFKIVRNSLRAA